MENKTFKNEEKEQGNVNVPGLIITIVLLIALCLGIFFFVRWIFTRSSTTDDVVEVNEEKEINDRLLKLLNDNINKTKIGEETLAYEVTSFTYSEKHFYISGYNGSTVYRYNLDLTTTSLATTKDALNYLKENEIGGSYDITLNRCTPSESNEFVAKYVGEGVESKYHIATFGSEKYAYATILKNNVITVINGDVVSDTLSVGYTPLTISNSDPLFNVYKYIATK